jgi:NAD(P)-dependent dehydrogenase (short-subunit alcohol dehydrogenase family)
LEAARREVEELAGRALVLPLDLADAGKVEFAASRVEEELGPIDIWINNAMASVFSPVRETTAEEYRRVTEVTYLGTVHGTLAALRRMLPATGDRSSRWARPWRTAASRCNRPTARPSTRSRGSAIRYAAS